ncbi:MAG TPA: sulfotransferase domain-containing protein [Rhizomicrobium sp.]
MANEIDVAAAASVFMLPSNDGAFEPEQASYLRSLGKRRASVMLAFAPKAAGTFLRMAAIYAVDGQLTRVVHAQGGRDATPYFPVYILYLAGGFPDHTLVTHVHMQALPANRHFIEAFDLRPAIMLRSVPDMLVSYLDMLAAEPASSSLWLNASIPSHFASMGDETKLDFMIDTIMPWYASYFATWLDYSREAPGRVCVLRYADLLHDPVYVLQTLLDHCGLPHSVKVCQLAVDAAWQERHQHRFNRGEDGRGRARLSPTQLARIEHLLFDYYDLEAWRAELFPEN